MTATRKKIPLIASDANLDLTGSVAIAGSGSAVITFPSETTTLATTDQTQTLTNKTLSTGSVIGEATMSLGSDADGDIYYRASNKLARLPKGTASQVLTMNSGATTPEWADASGGGATVKTIIPKSVLPFGAINNNIALNTNTKAICGMINIPASITVNKITLSGSSFVAEGTLKIAIYSEDGQTRHIYVETPTISSSNTAIVTSVSSVSLSAGNYYIAVVPVGSTSLSIFPFLTTDQVAKLNNLSGERYIEGTLTVTAGTLPSTINPESDITTANLSTAISRLDN